MSLNTHITKHKKTVFSLYRAKLRLANSMGYSYGSYYDKYIDDLTLCNNYVNNGKILDSPDKDKIIGSTIKIQYKKYMNCSSTEKVNKITDRGFIWLRKMNDLYFKYLQKGVYETPQVLLLPETNNSYNEKPLRF